MAKSAYVEDIDLGWAAVLSEIRSLQGVEIKSGILPPEGEKRPQGGGASVAEYATYNEFGTRTIPARSFMSRYFDVHQSELLGKLRDAAQLAAQGIDPNASLHVVGQIMRDGIRASIDSRVWIPNAPSTIAKKGSDNPLIDKGIMKHSVTSEVNK